MAGAIGPVREVHVWGGAAERRVAAKYDRPHGFYNDSQITDRFPQEIPVPPNINWELWIGPAPMRLFHATYLPGPRFVSVVGLRQRHDERSGRPRQRRHVSGVGW